MAASAGYRTLSAQKVVSAVAAGPAVESLALGELERDGGTQMRAGLNMAVVHEYRDDFISYRGWGAFPPIHAHYDGANYWTDDGFHRLAGFELALALEPARMAPDVRVIVVPGDRRAAILAAAGANADHGLRRSVDDKRRAVDLLLADGEWGDWSDAEIARRCKVSAPFVASRRELRDQSVNVAASVGNGAAHVPATERRYVRAGEVRTMNTAGITASNAARSVMPSSAGGSRSKGAEVARCSVCNRPLSDPAHAAAGMGPVCACKQVGGGPGSDEEDQAAIDRVRVPREVAIRNMRTRFLAVLDDLAFYEEQTNDKPGSRAIRNLMQAAINRLEIVAGVR